MDENHALYDIRDCVRAAAAQANKLRKQECLDTLNMLVNAINDKIDYLKIAGRSYADQLEALLRETSKFPEWEDFALDHLSEWGYDLVLDAIQTAYPEIPYAEVEKEITNILEVWSRVDSDDRAQRRAEGGYL